MGEYIVKQGDCIESIAHKHHFFWETIWGHPRNVSLREKRKNHNVLFPGDVVFIPEKSNKQEPAATGQRHRFRRKGVPCKLHIQLIVNEEPLSNEEYVLVVDGKSFSGTTDADGHIKQIIPNDAKKGKLLIGTDKEEYPFDIGYLNPAKDISGVQARLNNLGYNCGAVDGKLGPKTRAALEKFQEKQGLPQTGKPDQRTRDALENAHGN